MWSQLDLAENQWKSFEIGKLTLYLKKKDDEIISISDLSAELYSFRFGDDKVPDEDTDKLRILIDKSNDTFRLLPSLPDRPIVVSSLSPLRMPPKHEALFFVGIPIWVQLVAGRKKQVLLEKPSELLSNTWYGTPADGVLSYKVDSYLLRHPDPEIFVPSTAVCPVHIRNNTREVFDFHRVSIYAPFLNIYGSGNNLWTNQVQVISISENRVNVSVDNGPPQLPQVDTDLKLLNDRRETMDKNLLKKSFSIIKTVTGL